MRRLVLAAATALALLVGAAPASAASYCSPSGDSCKSVTKVQGRWTFQLSTAALYASSPRYRLCVRDPRRKERCKTFTLRAGRYGTYASRVTWSAHFPTGGRGTHRVRWDHQGITYGPSLRFKR